MHKICICCIKFCIFCVMICILYLKFIESYKMETKENNEKLDNLIKSAKEFAKDDSLDMAEYVRNNIKPVRLGQQMFIAIGRKAYKDDMIKSMSLRVNDKGEVVCDVEMI